jgi:hypothetical protein
VEMWPYPHPRDEWPFSTLEPSKCMNCRRHLPGFPPGSRKSRVFRLVADV